MLELSLIRKLTKGTSAIIIRPLLLLAKKIMELLSSSE